MKKQLLAAGLVSGLLLDQVVGNASFVPMDLSRSCSAGDTFGLFDRESGCGIGNCDCLPVLFNCDPSLASQLGECVLTPVGVMLLVLAALGSVGVPLILVLRYYYRDNQNASNLSQLPKEATSSRVVLPQQLHLDATPAGVHSPQIESKHDDPFFDMTHFRANVPAKVIGIDRSPNMKLETMSKGWINFVFLFLIASTVVCLVIFAIPVLPNIADQKMPIDNVQFINTTAYRIQVSINSTVLPRGTRYLSVLADICRHAVRTSFTPDHRINISYDMAFTADSIEYFESFVGFMVVQCICPDNITSACHHSLANESIHALTLVSMPWFRDEFNNQFSAPASHNFSFAATLDVAPHILSNVTFNNMTLRSSYSTAYPVVDGATYVFLALDILVLVFWLVVHCQTSERDRLPERRAVLVLLLINVLTTNSVMHLFHLVFYSSNAFLATQVWIITFHAAWLLSILVLIDMQRHRAFYHFHLVPAAVVIAVTLRHLSFFYYSATVTSLVDLTLSIASLWVFRGVVMSTLGSLRRRHYVATRARQLTVSVLYVVSFSVPYIDLVAAVTADPSPVIHTFLSRNSALTTLPTQIIVRAATLVLVLIFLPPPSSPEQSDVTGHAMVVLTTTATAPLSASASTAVNESIFSIETACALYNLSNHSYDAPPQRSLTTTATYDDKDKVTLMDTMALDRDQVRVLDSLLDVKSDTHGTVFLDDHNHRLVVAFRGTASKKNACTDFKIHAVAPTHWTTGTAADSECADIRLHAGFWDAYCSIRDQLHTALAAHTDKPWVFTGHSLGGALATIAAFDVSRTFKNTKVTMYNYGSPRVGNHAFAKAFSNRVKGFRVVNDGDVIVGEPMFAIDFTGGRVTPVNYKHVGTAVLLSERAHGTFIVDPNIVEQAFIAQLRGYATAHPLKAYKRRLQKGLQVAVQNNMSIASPTKKTKKLVAIA
ncbi:Aste57867_6521 [Aphanomyces stellatus]|uniref:Aste57867_6521 protein n=1 Tax=Aphanomyces stellatus TaxID=120398 RepID=A0A485KEU1_9STRA|nr:hypothetical protein As57867_006504 [Aphanomyces stellatus]VFT83503.1 Aste57867_6521 [Aphanomyces stellatus]